MQSEHKSIIFRPISSELRRGAAGSAGPGARLREHSRRAGITLTDLRGIPAARREHVISAINAVSECCADRYEAWAVPGRRPPCYSIRIVGPHGFYREVRLEGREVESAIAERLRMEIAPESAAR